MKRKYIICLVVICLTSCEEALETSLDGKKVTLLAPVNNLVTTDTLHTFYWSELNGAVQYELQVVSPRFDSIVRLIEDTVIMNNILHLDLNAGDYQWRVIARNNSSHSDNGESWNLKIQ